MQLRIAMRMSYVNPTEAQRIAQNAVAAGVIEANEDNAMLHVAENRSGTVVQQLERLPHQCRFGFRHERIRRPPAGRNVRERDQRSGSGWRTKGSE